MKNNHSTGVSDVTLNFIDFSSFSINSQCFSLDIIVLSCSTTFNLAENLFEVKEKKKKKSVNWQVK